MKMAHLYDKFIPNLGQVVCCQQRNEKSVHVIKTRIRSQTTLNQNQIIHKRYLNNPNVLRRILSSIWSLGVEECQIKAVSRNYIYLLVLNCHLFTEFNYTDGLLLV